MSVSDSSYKKFAEQVYNVEPSKAKSNGEPVVFKGRIFRAPVTKQKYKVLSVQDNNNDVETTNDNGMIKSSFGTWKMKICGSF